jgi:hypothetical protein
VSDRYQQAEQGVSTELVTADPPRSLDDLCLRLSLGDWAAAAPNREFSLIRRSR